ncbi:AAA family ATPase [Actinomadura flavalba]|uniref:AAA family ATPase n=1 Tax=Actinomadura flavalba TaxID=1120938 RepID=UPI0003739653|nr:AAA family ATPase [Actinomadura flavalba]
MNESQTIADRLRAARRRRFVGRTAELAFFRAALRAPEPPFSVLFVHGPGGTGKTALLDAFAALAEEEGVPAWYRDGRAAEAPRDVLGPPPGSSGEPARRVMLVDSYERLAAFDDRFRQDVVPRLPAGTLVVVAGREPPGPAWTADPGWRELLHVVPLRNLPPADATAYLRAEQVPERLHRDVLAATHGHPLALALLADVLSQCTGTGDLDKVVLGDTPDVVRRLLDRFLEEVPSARHRHALEVCAHAMLTTEDLLRAALDDPDAGELFEWMRRLSFVEEESGGLRPHDLAREVFDTDLRWRDRAAYTRVHRRVRGHLLDRIAARGGAEQQGLVAELTFLHRADPVIRAFLDFTHHGTHSVDGLRPADVPALAAMTARHEDAAAAWLVEYWAGRQPDAFVVVRAKDGAPAGFGVRLDLTRVTDADRAADPAVAALTAYLHRNGPPAPGETAAASRFFVDREAHQAPSVSLTPLLTAFVQRRFTAPRLTYDFLAAYTDVDGLTDLFAFGGFQRAHDADFTVGGRRHRVFVRDFRRGGVAAWADLIADNELHFAPPPPVAPPAPLLALSRPEFAAAVRQALRDLHRPAALTASPLAASRSVRDAAPAPVADALAALLRAAAATLPGDPRGDRAHRAVDRTYLRPAPTQERAAEVLGLPLSTYRRHLSSGLARIVEVLWQWELYGRQAR